MSPEIPTNISWTKISLDTRAKQFRREPNNATGTGGKVSYSRILTRAGTRAGAYERFRAGIRTWTCTGNRQGLAQ